MILKHTLCSAVIGMSALAATQFTESGASHRGLARADEKAAEIRDATWVNKRIEGWQPNKAERAFDEIGWVKSLGEARRFAETHGRPIFLFTYDGADLACYRC